MTVPARRRRYRWWEVAGAAAALATASTLTGPGERESREDYRSRPQPAYAPPAWLFLPAWLAWKALAIRADTALLNAAESVLPPPRRRALLAARTADWLLWTSTETVGVRLGSPRLALLWALGQFASTAGVIGATRRPAPAIARALAPQLAWLAFAVAVGVGQVTVQPDRLRERGAVVRGRAGSTHSSIK
jgi:tryptophan-rich sensory protein